MLTRYAEVLAALREPRLSPTGPAEPQPERPLFKQLAEACMPQMQALAEQMLREIPTGRPVDLVGEFAEPWCLELAVLVCRADSAKKPRLFDVARAISAAAAEPRDAALRERAAAAQAQLDLLLQPAGFPGTVPAFVGLSQTLPCLLANAWLALFDHPAEMTRLRAGQTPVPNAIEELLRFAEIPIRISRRATAVVEVGGVRIAGGDYLVRLMIAQANRDERAVPDSGPSRFLALRWRPAFFRRGSALLRGGAAHPHSCCHRNRCVAAIPRVGATCPSH